MCLLRKQLCLLCRGEIRGRCTARGAAAFGLKMAHPALLSLSSAPCSTASNSNRSTPACSPILRKRSRSPTPQDAPGDAMVEKGSDHSSDKSPSTPEQGVQRSCSSQSGRSGAKNSKVRSEQRALAVMSPVMGLHCAGFVLCLLFLCLTSLPLPPSRFS